VSYVQPAELGGKTSSLRRAKQVVFSVALIWFLHLSLLRFVDGDEGYYALAAEMVAAGALPYVDFFYPQMPILPYLYAIFSWVLGGVDWYQLRIVSAFLAAISALIVYMLVQRRAGLLAGIFAALLFCSHPFVMSEFTLVKSYAATCASLLLACYLIESAKSPKVLVMAGACFAISVGCRLYIGVLGPFFLFMLFQRRGELGSWKALRYFLFGICVVALPIGLLALLGPFEFWFNNFTYHIKRDEAELGSQIAHRLHVLLVALGVRESAEVNHSQFLSVLLLALALGWKRAAYSRGFVVVALLLFAMSLVPSPPYVQYFALVVPFLIVAALSGAALSTKSVRYCVGIILLVTGVPAAFGKYQALTQSGEGLLGIPVNMTEAYSLRSVRTVSSLIRSSGQPEVLSLWPGYLVGSGAAPVPGFENQFAHKIASRFTGAGQRERLKLATFREAKSMAMSGEYGLVVGEGIFSVPLNPVLQSDAFNCEEAAGAKLCSRRK
jgi:4-amino-4-deoxy-L-arabinose transferase-like glycosyltransferase